RQGAAPSCTNTVGNRVQSLLVTGCEHHGGARFCKCAGSYFSNPAACTRNEGDLTGERRLDRRSGHSFTSLAYRSLYVQARLRCRWLDSVLAGRVAHFCQSQPLGAPSFDFAQGKVCRKQRDKGGPHSFDDWRWLSVLRFRGIRLRTSRGVAPPFV